MVKFAIAAFAALLFIPGLAAGASETVLLDFASPYCGPCREMEPAIQRLISAGHPVRRVDVTREPELAARYGVSRVPCFVMLQQGEEVDRVVGATSFGRLEGMLQRVRERLSNRVPRIRTQSPDQLADQRPTLGRHESPPLSSAPHYTPPMAAGPSPMATASGPVRAPQPIPPVGQMPQQYPPTETIQAPTSTTVAMRPEDLINSSVRLRIEDPEGRSFGTGTIIDARSGEALIVTCGHLFRDSQGQGRVTVELFEATPDGVRVVGEVAGQVISYDLDRDIGLVSIHPGRTVSVAPIAPGQYRANRGDRVASVGCDQGADPTVLSTRVTAVDRYQGLPNIEAAGAPVEGRSGGGLFNAEGQLIGVCFAADYEGNEGLYSALQSIHDELDRIGLADIYQQTAAAPNQLAAAGPADESVVRGQVPLEPVAPIPTNVATTAASVPATQPAANSPNLSGVEQAAWEEIMSRAASSEVICIIRPKEPGAMSEVITLDSVSPEFVRALAERTGAGTTR